MLETAKAAGSKFFVFIVDTSKYTKETGHGTVIAADLQEGSIVRWDPNGYNGEYRDAEANHNTNP